MEKRKLLECIDFFKKLYITEKDVTTEEERSNGQLVVIATYSFENKSYTTNRLYYKNIDDQNAVKNKNVINSFFGEPVFWLDIDVQGWPASSGTKLTNTVIADMSNGNLELIHLLEQLANDQKTGFVQQISWEGRSAHYSFTLENNNHWHDLINLIQAVIQSGGREIDKKYFSRLVFEWDNEQRTSLHPYFGSRSLIQSLYKNIKSAQMSINDQDVVNLIKYKKQIVLQGPPGTGKTHTAKKIAKELTRKRTINPHEIKSFISVSQSINSCTDYTTYVVDAITENGVKLKTVTGTVYETKYTEIIDSFERKIWENSQVKNGNDSYSAAIAKYINENLENDQVKIIQFHPAYSYEDFVRGIVVKPSGQNVLYEAENKVLAQFAEKAQQNLLNSQKASETLSKENWLDKEFALFVEEVEAHIADHGKYAINNTISLFDIDEDAFRYTGNEWKVSTRQRMKFSDLKAEFLANVQSRIDIKKLTNISGRAREHSSYDFMVIEMFRTFLKKRPAFTPATTLKEEEKNYVLIVDEINRANLPAVLGELIYALEYRDESVESIYAIDKDTKLTLPRNLYIIGTMNTADRSVGHIDYAIRRRFAFVDILPSDVIIDEVVKEPLRARAKLLFQKVALLFKKENIAPDFKANDVQLGHSYFIADKEENFKLKLNYEIKPLLKEYIRDGILQTTVSVNGTPHNTEEYINTLTF